METSPDLAGRLRSAAVDAALAAEPNLAVPAWLLQLFQVRAMDPSEWKPYAIECTE